jgi:hypothetical protein
VHLPIRFGFHFPLLISTICSRRGTDSLFGRAEMAEILPSKKIGRNRMASSFSSFAKVQTKAASWTGLKSNHYIVVEFCAPPIWLSWLAIRAQILFSMYNSVFYRDMSFPAEGLHLGLLLVRTSINPTHLRFVGLRLHVKPAITAAS